MEKGLCRCGCGGKTSLSRETNKRLGRIQGQPLDFLPGHHRRVLAGYDEVPGILDTPCRIWRSKPDAHGYCHIMRDGKRHLAHRFIYEREVGSIPPLHVLHHRCEDKRCVNTDHLEVLTRSEHASAHYSHGY